MGAGLTTFSDAVEDLVERTDANRTQTTVVSRRASATLDGDPIVLRSLLARRAARPSSLQSSSPRPSCTHASRRVHSSCSPRLAAAPSTSPSAALPPPPSALCARSRVAQRGVSGGDWQARGQSRRCRCHRHPLRQNPMFLGCRPKGVRLQGNAERCQDLPCGLPSR